MLRDTLFLATFLASGLLNVPSAFALEASAGKPNIVFILADDQDAKLNSLDYMPNLQKQLVQKGTHFRKHYCTVAWCCPSRVSLWTGKAAHNTNVTNVEPPYGGYPKFIDQGLNDNWLPVWLEHEGYNSYYTGKLMNYHHVLNYFDPFPKGFAGSDFLLDPGTYSYLNPIFQRNKSPPVHHTNEYNTDLVVEKGLGFIEEAVQAKKPFFVTIAPIVLNTNITLAGESSKSSPIAQTSSPPIPAPRHANLFEDAVVPRTPSFNPDVPSGADWIAELPQLSPENVTFNDLWYRQRLRSLQVIDELIDSVIEKLDAHGVLDNTYVIYSSDNGYHISQHRLAPGKGCGIEEDINVPLVVRGPGVPSGKTVDLATSHTDLAPTFFSILGITLRDDFDGVPIPVTEKTIEDLESSGKAKEHVQVEFWSKSTGQEYNADYPEVNNTYKAIRIVGSSYGFYYSVWCGGDHELYDMTVDPDQMHNYYTTSSNGTFTTSGNVKINNHTYSTSKISERLDGLLYVLKTCKAKTCSEPWATLMPNTGVTSLAQAMDSKYDAYFAGLTRVEYERCEEGYIADAEGPVFENGEAYSGAGMIKKHRGPIRNRP
ncbi:arylsulfatase [Lophiotrema nucula]|uniref:Arylsulfatase n=1 Tax=Lophiotrema nucula TaxID=690887 RepID=A0A6A5YIY9_9PLEO|nr:arylsulfatase [Lophiotrema nucula]